MDNFTTITSHSNNNIQSSTPDPALVAAGRQGLITGLGFTSPTRSSIIDWKADNKAPSLTSLVTLEDLRDLSRKMESLSIVEDRLFNLSQCGLSVTDGVLLLHPVLVGKDGRRMAQEPLVFDNTGFSQFCSALTTWDGRKATGANGLSKVLASLRPLPSVSDDQRVKMRSGFGKMAASMLMAFLACTDKMMQFRTVLKPIGINPVTGKRETARFIRAVVSPSYACVSNHEVISTLLDEMGNYSAYRYKFADSGMFLRLVDPSSTGGQIKLKEQYPVINAWNSETGQRQVGIGAGTFNWWCLNGCGDYRQTSNFERRHIGDATVIRNMLGDSLVGIRTANSNLIRQFEEAKSIVIDDAFDWISSILGGMNGVTQKTIEGLGNAMKDETSGERNTLGNVVNGMTLLAHNPDFGFGGDLWDQIDLEKKASKVLARGIRQADANNKLFAPKIEA